MDEFAAIDDEPTHYGNINHGVTDPLVDHLPIRDLHDGAVLSVVVSSRGQTDRSVLVDRDFIRISLFPSDLAMRGGCRRGTGYAMF